MDGRLKEVSFVPNSQTGTDKPVLAGLAGRSSIARYGPCGIMASIEVTVSAGPTLTVTAAGSPGLGCTWTSMAVQVQLQNAVTGEWETKEGYEGEGQNWSRQYSGEGYDAYRAKTTSYDAASSAFIEERHRVTTGWLTGQR